MGDDWSLETAGTHTGRLVPAILVALLAATAGVGYVAAATMLGRGSLTVNVTAPPSYAISVQFYSDEAGQNQISSVDIPQGTYTIVYAKLRNVSGSAKQNLYIGGGGDKLWMNVWKLDGTPLYTGGQMQNYFALNANEELMVKVQVGLEQTAVQGNTLTLGLEVWQA